MGAVVALSTLLDAQQVWRGRAAPLPAGEQPTGWAALDDVLPAGGTVAGVKVAEAPGGRPETSSPTEPAKPFARDTVTV